MARIAYLGPQGTFTEAAMLQLVAGDPDFEPVACDSSSAAVEAVRVGSADYACVPIENSIEGGVSATLDYLALPTAPLQIVAEVVIPVSFDLCVRPGTTLAQVQRVISHPHAIAQVRGEPSRHVEVERVFRRAVWGGGTVGVAGARAGGTHVERVRRNRPIVEARVARIDDALRAAGLLDEPALSAGEIEELAASWLD